MSDNVSLTEDELSQLIKTVEPSEGSIGNLFQDKLESSLSARAVLLGEFIDKNVTTPLVRCEKSNLNSFLDSVGTPFVLAKSNIQGPVTGTVSYFMSEAVALQMLPLMMGQDDVILDSSSLAALDEVFSGYLASLITSLERAGVSLTPAPFQSLLQENRDGITADEESFVASYSYRVEGLDNALELYEVWEPAFVENISGSLAPPPVVPEAPNNTPPENRTSSNASPITQNVQLSPFNNVTLEEGETQNINLLMDVRVELSVELGRTKWKIRDILSIGEGTIIELDKLNGEAVDVLVNKRLIAKGEVVIIDENFGVRVTEIVTPIEQLGYGITSL